MTDWELMEKAQKARERAYCPYSSFAVGAALLTKSGRVYTGCNIENAAFGPTVCAERTAFFAAVAAGEREFAALAVLGGPADAPGRFTPPCGVCRQVMAEFCSPGFRILLGCPESFRSYSLEELMPLSFGADRLSE